MMNEATTGELRAAEIDLLWQTAPPRMPILLPAP